MSTSFTDLRELRSARISCDETVLQCTGRNQPICKSRAMPSASRRSVLIGIAFSAAFTRRVSISTASKPASVSPLCSHCDSGPASSPTAAIPCGSSCMNETRASGALATRASVTIFPFSPRTQIAVLASDTSRPI